VSGKSISMDEGERENETDNREVLKKEKVGQQR
jgi:hypothetical protein